MEDELKRAIQRCSEETGEPPQRIEIAFCKNRPEDDDGAYYWRVKIIFTRAKSRTGGTGACEGFGNSISEAADDGVRAFRRAVEYGYAKKGS